MLTGVYNYIILFYHLGHLTRIALGWFKLPQNVSRFVLLPKYYKYTQNKWNYLMKYVIWCEQLYYIIFSIAVSGKYGKRTLDSQTGGRGILFRVGKRLWWHVRLPISKLLAKFKTYKTYFKIPLVMHPPRLSHLWFQGSLFAVGIWGIQKSLYTKKKQWHCLSK